MRELEKIQHMIDEETEVFAVVLVSGNNDYMILPTRYTSVTYRGKDQLTSAFTNATTALEPHYKVRTTHLNEVDAVKYLKNIKLQSGITAAVLELYKYKYPELWI